MGGRSTTYVAAKHAQRVAGLALIDHSPENAPAGSKRVTQTVANTPERFASIEAAMRFFGLSHRQRFEAYLNADLSLKRDTYFRDQFRNPARPKLGVDLWQLIGEVRCPLLSMRGTRSDLYAAETVPKMKPPTRACRWSRSRRAQHRRREPAGLHRRLAAVPGRRGGEKPWIREALTTWPIVADDMPTAMDFYTRVMGFQLVHVRRVPYEQDAASRPTRTCATTSSTWATIRCSRSSSIPRGCPSSTATTSAACSTSLSTCRREVRRAHRAGEELPRRRRRPVALGARFWSAYLFDPFGIRLEFATDRSGAEHGVVESVLQSEDEARAELETLFSNPQEVQKWLRHMPSRKK